MTCRNCNHLISTKSLFCEACGEKTTFKRLTIKTFISDFFNQFLSIDNKFLKTFLALFTKPENVIDSYIQGFRKNYINVIPYLGLSITLIGIQFFVLKQFFPELMAFNLPTEMPGNFDFNSILNKVHEYQGLIAILSIPVYALISRFVFIDMDKYNIAEHLVIITYSAAQLYILTFVLVIISLPLNINFNTLSTYIFIPTFLYVAFVYKNLYPISWKSALLRSLAYNTLTVVFVFLTSAVLSIIYFIIKTTL